MSIPKREELLSSIQHLLGDALYDALIAAALKNDLRQAREWPAIEAKLQPLIEKFEIHEVMEIELLWEFDELQIGDLD